ncbi:MAG: MFS transporter [Promethearchaeota archaeon]
MNWNIRLAYVQTVCSAFGMGIIQVAFSIFVTNNPPQGLGQTNLILGNLFTIQGVGSTIFVIPSGIFADKYRRDLLIRISVIFGLSAQLALIYATFLTGTPNVALIILIFSEVLGGIGWGLSGPAAQALIADSIEPGLRSKVFAKMFFANLIASAVGPFIAAGFTLIFGDTWDLTLLQNLIITAAIIAIVAYLAVIFASDEKALVPRVKIQESLSSTTLPKQDVQIIKGDPVVTLFGHSFTYDVITPSILVISGIIIGFGAGATVAFFPILFARGDIGYGLPPFLTYVIFGITSVITGLAALVAQRIIRLFGRIGSMFLTQGLAIICLLGLMINLVLYQNQDIAYSISVFFLIFFYISRNALMNAAGPVSRSIVMDTVPSNSRAKWNSLETLAWGMFWSLSASIGGFIIDNFGFVYVFLFTASLYTIATLMILIIRNRVPKESILTRTYQLGKLKARNRVVMPSSSVSGIKAGEVVNGQITYKAISYYAKAAEDGAGLVYLEPAYISLSGKSNPHQIGIHDDYVISRLEEVIKKVHEYGSLIGIRLTHAGGATKKSICGVQPIAPSAIPISDRDPPRSLTLEEISQLRNEFAEAAIRAARAGFDVIEISSVTHKRPDLLGQFLSPEYNQRNDEYGGSFTNRIQFPLEVARAIRANLPPKIMLAYYLAAPLRGLSDEELSIVVKYIEQAGIELFCIDYVFSELENGEEADLARFIRKIKDDLPHIPIVCSGDFDVESAEEAIKRGQADLVAFGTFSQENLALQLSLR